MEQKSPVADVADNTVWKISIVTWIGIAITFLSLLYIFQDTVGFLLHQWEREEYSHAYLIPAICAFFVWQKKNHVESVEFTGSWIGVFLTLFGFFIYLLGVFSAVNSIISYAIVWIIISLVWAYTGSRAFKHIVVPLSILFFMVPIPGFLFETLSGNLQLISSQIGVAVIRLFDISVFLEGNVIDLGVYKLQVVEACSGLRYLFPLLTLGFIAAYMYHEVLWKRIFIFLSSIPITVLMNSFRIGVIGILVEYWGLSMAEGFLHDFEGWIVFMACVVVLVLEMWLLSLFSAERRPFINVFGLNWPEPADPNCQIRQRQVPVQFYAVFSIVVVSALLFTLVPERKDIIPERNSFAQFPQVLDGRVARNEVMKKIYQDSLKFDDYILADYISQSNPSDAVNLYVAYYDVQRADKVPHSPKACIPGGGWKIDGISTARVDDITISGVPLTVNRLVIKKDDIQQLVYYWFQQRGRIITNEYKIKWYLFSDAITRNRTDGALIRLTTVIFPGQDMEDADKKLSAFARKLSPIIPEYIPQ